MNCVRVREEEEIQQDAERVNKPKVRVFDGWVGGGAFLLLPRLPHLHGSGHGLAVLEA